MSDGLNEISAPPLNQEIGRQLALSRLNALPPGRHHGASSNTGCWVMVGRNLPEAFEWSAVPPAASLTMVWGKGGCSLAFEGGALQANPGDWMWIDSGFAHRGEGVIGSDFLTFFLPDPLVEAAGLDIAPIGASSMPAPPSLSGTLMTLAVLVLDDEGELFERPAIDALLEYVGTEFDPNEDAMASDGAVYRARLMISEAPLDDTPVSKVAQQVGLSDSELSKRFKARFGLSPVVYRKQLRLTLATRELAAGRTVTAAARRAGFSDTAHLSRTFKGQYGISPKDWLERVARKSRLGS